MKKSIFSLLYCTFIALSLIRCKYDKNNNFLVVNKSGIKIDSAAISRSGTDY